MSLYPHYWHLYYILLRSYVKIIASHIYIFVTRLSEWGYQRGRLRGKRSKDGFWTGMSEVVGTEASQTQVLWLGRTQFLQKSWRTQRRLVLHHWQEQKMGGVRRPRVWHRSVSLIGKISSTSRSECLSSLKHNALDITLPLPPQIVRLVMEKTTRVKLTRQSLEKIARTGLCRNPTNTSSKTWANTASAGILTTTQRSGVTPQTRGRDGRIVTSQNVDMVYL